MSKLDNKKKVLYISRSYENDSPVGARYSHFKEYLNSYVQLSVLNLTDKMIVFSKRNRFEVILNKIFLKIPIKPDPEKLILCYYKKRIKKYVKSNSFDTIIIQVLPFSFITLVSFFKQNWPHLRVVLDMSDPYSSNVKNRLSSPKAKAKMIDFEKKHLSRLDHLIVLNSEIKQYYDALLSGLVKVSVVEQGLDRSSVFHEDKITFHDNKKLIKFIYAGAFYEGIREPFELYHAILNSHHDVKLSVFGGFKRIFVPPTHERLTYGGKVNRNMLMHIYSESDILVFIDNKDAMQVPGKILETQAMNKPLLFIYYNDGSPTHKYLIDQHGVYKTKNSSHEIETVIDQIIRDLPSLQINRDLNNFEWGTLLNRLDKII